MARTKVAKKWKFLKVNGVMDRTYKVSDHGDIIRSACGTALPQSELDKKSPFNSTDYQAVTLYGKRVRVHRIVCETFHGPAPEGKTIVHHKDERKNNNRASNLEWSNQSENRIASIQKYGIPRYTEAKIRRVKRLINKGHTNDSIAQKVGMSDSNVSKIRYGDIHRHVEPLTEEQLELARV